MTGSVRGTAVPIAEAGAYVADEQVALVEVGGQCRAGGGEYLVEPQRLLHRAGQRMPFAQVFHQLGEVEHGRVGVAVPEPGEHRAESVRHAHRAALGEQPGGHAGKAGLAQGEEDRAGQGDEVYRPILLGPGCTGGELRGGCRGRPSTQVAAGAGDAVQ